MFGRACLLLVAVSLTCPWLEAQEGVRTRRTKEAIIKSNTSKDVALAVGKRIDNFCTTFEEFYDGLGLKPELLDDDPSKNVPAPRFTWTLPSEGCCQ